MGERTSVNGLRRSYTQRPERGSKKRQSVSKSAVSVGYKATDELQEMAAPLTRKRGPARKKRVAGIRPSKVTGRAHKKPSTQKINTAKKKASIKEAIQKQLKKGGATARKMKGSLIKLMKECGLLPKDFSLNNDAAVDQLADTLSKPSQVFLICLKGGGGKRKINKPKLDTIKVLIKLGANTQGTFQGKTALQLMAATTKDGFGKSALKYLIKAEGAENKAQAVDAALTAAIDADCTLSVKTLVSTHKDDNFQDTGFKFPFSATVVDAKFESAGKATRQALQPVMCYVRPDALKDAIATADLAEAEQILKLSKFEIDESVLAEARDTDAEVFEETVKRGDALEVAYGGRQEGYTKRLTFTRLVESHMPGRAQSSDEFVLLRQLTRRNNWVGGDSDG